MFHLKVLFQIFILGSGNFVYSSDVNRQNVAHEIQPGYKFNHPPLLESYQLIPVAVVYEDEQTIIEKSIKPTVSTDANIISTMEEVKTKSVETNFSKNLSLSAFDHTEDADTKVLRHQRKQKLPKSTVNPSNELQIPVAVIYEPESRSTQRYNRNKRVNSSRQRVRERNQKIQQQDSTKTPTVENDFSKKATADQTTTKPFENRQTNKENYSSATAKVTKPGKRTRERDPVVPIIVSENRVYSHTGVFVYSYEGGDGTKAFEKGELKSFGDDSTGESVVGGFSYKDKDGKDFSLTYTADENGYRPVGAHLPTPPPIPPAIAQALLYLATKTTSEPVTEPSLKSTK